MAVGGTVGRGVGRSLGVFMALLSKCTKLDNASPLAEVSRRTSTQRNQIAAPHRPRPLATEDGSAGRGSAQAG